MNTTSVLIFLEHAPYIFCLSNNLIETEIMQYSFSDLKSRNLVTFKIDIEIKKL